MGRVVTFQLSFGCFASLMFFRHNFNRGTYSKENVTHRILVWFLGVFISVDTGHKNSVPPDKQNAR